MILANIITIAKYGLNIFLAIMGFISFEDINERQFKYGSGNGSNENNYVQFVSPNEFGNNVYYASEIYFPKDEKSINYMICKKNDAPIKTTQNVAEIIKERKEDISSKLYASIKKSLIEFDIIIVDPTEIGSVEKYIKVLSVNENYSSGTRISNPGITISDLIN